MPTTTGIKPPAGNSRVAAKAARRRQLIDATIESVAKRGFADTTLSDVARAAGLSQGIINLYFESKEKLFVETLSFLADEYRNAWEQALASAGDDPVDKLTALIELDFKAKLCDPKKLAVWFAFWGEAKSRPTYRKLCQDRDQQYDRAVLELCREIKAVGGYEDVDPEIAASSLSALTDGLWLDLLVPCASMTRQRARAISFAYIAGVFPRHFSIPKDL